MFNHKCWLSDADSEVDDGAGADPDADAEWT